MERWVAIILGLLIIVIGFVVVGEIIDAQNNMVDSGDDFQCALEGGACVENCAIGERIDAECSSGVCCAGG